MSETLDETSRELLRNRQRRTGRPERPEPSFGPLRGDAKLMEGARALLKVAARVAERLSPVEEVLRTGDRERYPWASLAQCLRHGLYGDGVGGDLEHPTPDSLLGQLRRMSDWGDERWSELYRAERAELIEDGARSEEQAAGAEETQAPSPCQEVPR